MPPRTKQSPKVDENAVRAYRIHTFGSIATSLIRYGGLAVIVYFGIFRPIEALAGNTTLATIAVDFVAGFRVNTALAWALSGGAVAYGLRERRLRQSIIERLAGQVQRLEGKRDQRRSSSRLTPKGLTNPGDEI